MAALDQSPATGRKKRKRSAPRIDMTPMVDLAFLLLTFFVMTTTLNKGYTLEVEQPISGEGPGKEIEAGKVLNLILGKNDQVFWYMGVPGSKAKEVDYSSAGVRKLLLQKNSEIKDLYVILKASDDSRYKNIVDMLDEISITNIPSYALLKLDPEDEKLLKQ